MKLDWIKLLPYAAILGLVGWILFNQMKIDSLEAKLKAESTISSSLSTTVTSLKAANESNIAAIAKISSDYQFIVGQVEGLDAKTATNSSKIKEIKNGRQTLANDGVGDAMLYSLDQLRGLHEAHYGSGKTN